MIRQFALNAIAEFRSGNNKDGMIWLQSYCEHRTDVFTPRLIEFVNTGDFEGAACLLDIIVREFLS